MSIEENQRLEIMEKKIEAVLTAIQGNSLGALGVNQHLERIDKRFDCMERKIDNRFKQIESANEEVKNEVKELKNDKRTIKGMIAGWLAAGGTGGAIAAFFGK